MDVAELAGQIGSGTNAPVQSYVSVTLNSVTESALVDTSGDFYALFDTTSLGAGVYTVTYAFAGNVGFTSAATDTSTTVTVTPALLTVTADPNQSMTYGATPALTLAQISAVGVGTFTVQLTVTEPLAGGVVLPLPLPEPPVVVVVPSDFTVIANVGKEAEETPSLAVITMLEYVPTLLAEGMP